MGLSDENRLLLARSVARGRALVAADPSLARSMPSADDFAHVIDGATSFAVVARAFAHYADRPAFGFRRRSLARDASTGRMVARAGVDFETMTYAEVWQRIVRLATGLDGAGLVAPGEFVALVGFSTVDHVVAELAGHHLGAPTVPLAKDVSASDFSFVLGECNPAAVFVSVHQLGRVAEIVTTCTSVRTLVVMDLVPGDESHEVAVAAARAAAGPRVRVETMDAVEAQGGARPALVARAPRDGDDTLVTLVYTSGSTGTPKGAEFHEGCWLPRWRTLPFMELTSLPMVSLVFLPQNHMGGRNAVANSLRLGGLAYFTHESDMSSLLDDLRAVRPTYLHLVPRLSEMVHRHYQHELARRGGSEQAAREIVEEMGRTYWGDRMLLALTASAPTPPPVATFIKRCFDIPIVDVFAGTEYGQLFVDGRINTENVREHKLVSVPELGYLETDQPHPRGELRVKTVRAIRRYFKNEEATRALVDEDGFLCTGDVFERTSDGAMRWIDRKNNVLKLAQGEFVNVSRLEKLFATESRFIAQVYILGSSTHAYLVGVLVPEHDAVNAELARAGTARDDDAVRALLRAEIARVAAAHALAPYEVLRDFIVEDVPFTRERGLLTSLDKPARPALKAHYGAAVHARYAAIDRAASATSAARADVDADAPLTERIARRAALVLGMAPDALDPARTFRHLGGDSLAAANLAVAIEREHGVRLSAGFVLGPTTSLVDLAAAVEAQRSGTDATALSPSTFERVHGAAPVALAARDLVLARFFPELAATRTAPPSRTARAHVLLTGATGFLGRFLALALLERAAQTGGAVTCIVRGASTDAARARLAASYGLGSPLHARFESLATDRLRVVAGDLARPNLGLDAATFDALADDTDAIVHAAAHVNHALSYAELFDENVAATAGLLALAVRGRTQRFDLVSTNTVSLALARDGVIAREADDTRARGDGWPIAGTDARHADGYRASKWAAEVVAQDAAEHFGLAVNVFRVSLILPPVAEDARAEIHREDFLTRLVVSLAKTGVAPRSFYGTSAAGATPHLDGLPVDFIAAAIAALGPATDAGFAVHHVNNVHWSDGVSLDTVVDALARVVPIARIEDHAAWFERFAAALATLPPAERASSSLPILAQWRHPIAADARRVDAAGFSARVRALAPGGAADIPGVDAAYFARFIDALVAAGLIEASRGR